MGRLMGIDYGLKRVGLAVTDPLKIIATALTTVPTSDIFLFLKNYIQQEDVEVFVVGEPKNLNNTPTDATPHVYKFAEKLQETFPDIPVEFVDERFTSRIAFQSMIEGGVKKKDRRKKENLDSMSAAIILQSYLSKNF